MTIEVIKELENREVRANYNALFLCKVGTWLRAYEWSAYLSTLFPNDLDGKSKLKPIRKQIKQQDIIYVGFPIQSLNKYFPSINISSMRNDLLEINMSPFLDEPLTVDDYNIKLNQWKENYPLTLATKSSKSINHTIIDLLKNYPLASKTPMENTFFLSHLKELIGQVNS